MQTVNSTWYYIYKSTANIIAGIIVVLGLAGLFVERLAPTAQVWGLSGIVIFIAASILIYHGFLYERVAKSQSERIATIFTALLFIILATKLIHSTGELHSFYMILWGFLMLSSGMFGAYSTVFHAFIFTLYFVIAYSGTMGDGITDLDSIIRFLVIYGQGAFGYIFWTRHFIDSEDPRLKDLSGKLARKEIQSEILIGSISEGIIATDKDNRINLINPAAAEITGWGIEEARNMDVHTVLNLRQEGGKELSNNAHPFKLALNQRQTINATAELLDRKNNIKTISIVVSPIMTAKNKGPFGLVAVISDISNSRAEEQKRADFISTASHEMRTPVAAIEGYLALALNENVSTIDAKAREFLEKAHSSTQHLGKLFQDLLTSAKAEDGRLVSHPSVVEMGEFLEQVTDSLKFSAEKKGLSLDFIIGFDNSEKNQTSSKIIKPLYYVHVDPDRLREVITNLFDNAVKYTPEGKVSIGLTGNQEYVQFYVKDTGVGIPKADVPHMFQKFYRVDSSATRTIGGTGLGLFISRKIIELYKGRIWVESEQGKGSTFYINLPRLTTQKAESLMSEELNEYPATQLSPTESPVGHKI
jgi:PAS domain S-box-containing protein